MSGRHRPRISVFVGREDILAAVTEGLSEGNRSYLVDATGPWGIGKTALLDKIKSDLDQGRTYLAIRGDLGPFAPESPPGPESTLSTRELQCNFDQFCALLVALADIARSAAFDGFRIRLERERGRIAEAVDKVDVRVETKFVVRRGSAVSGSDVGNVADPTDAVVRAAIASVRPTVARHFTEALSAASATARSVLLLDEFDRLSGHPIADWVLELARGLSTTVVVLTTKSDCRELASDVSRHPLQRFTAEQVRRYLGEVASTLSGYTGRPVSLPPSVADELFTFSGGYPQLVGLGADMVIDRILAGAPESEIPGVFADVPVEMRAKVVELVRRLKVEVADDDLKAALGQTWVLRRLDEDVLERVLFSGEKRLPEAERKLRARSALRQLSAYSFVAPDPAGGYRFHEFVREALEEQMASDPTVPDPAEVHTLASAYYRERTVQFEGTEGDPSSYEGWFRYEEPVWQNLKREWLYHTAVIEEDADCPEAGVALARIFLEAFWWYGWYTYFPFCEQLLDDWERTQPSRRHEWSRPLRKLLESYPKRASQGWADVEEALLDLSLVGGIESRAPQELDGDARRVRALISVFLGNCARAGDPAHLAGAERYYREAYELFELVGETVALPYTALCVAEVALERARDDEALEWCARAFDLARASRTPDYEAIAGLYRFLGDLLTAKGDHEGAVDAYGRALVAAYVFNGFPRAPDNYTAQFYRDHLERTATRLCEIWRIDGPQAALDACATLRAAFAGYWRTRPDPNPADETLNAALSAADAAALAILLFPPGPTEDEIGKKVSNHRRHAQRVWRERSVQLLDPGGLLAAQRTSP